MGSCFNHDQPKNQLQQDVIKDTLSKRDEFDSLDYYTSLYEKNFKSWLIDTLQNISKHKKTKIPGLISTQTQLFGDDTLGLDIISRSSAVVEWPLKSNNNWFIEHALEILNVWNNIDLPKGKFEIKVIYTERYSIPKLISGPPDPKTPNYEFSEFFDYISIHIPNTKTEHYYSIHNGNAIEQHDQYFKERWESSNK